MTMERSKTPVASTPTNPPKQRSFGFSNFLVKWLSRLITLSAFIGACIYLDSIKERWYIFDPTEIHDFAKAAIAHTNDTAEMVRYIHTALSAKHPGHIAVRNDEWVFNNAGGAMGAMVILHVSITEYLMVFGTPLGTEGHTGLLGADDYFNILTGEQWAFSPPNLEMERYPAGSVHHLPRMSTKQYKMHKGCFALEYARGWIPLMVPFGFADGLTSTLDVPTLWHMVIYTSREILRNLAMGKI